MVWAFFGFLIAAGITGESILIELISAVILFAISFVIHKNYSSLSFRDIRSRTNDTENIVMNDSFIKENVVFCPKCGKRIRNIDGKCDTCDR